MNTRLQKVFSIGKSVIAGLAGGAVLGSSFGFTTALFSSLAGGIIGGITQHSILKS